MAGRLQILTGHAHVVRCAVFSGDGRRLATASADATVRIWETTSGTCVQTLRSGCEDSVNVCVFTCDDGLLVSSSGKHTLHVWNPTNGAHVHTLTPDHASFLCAVAHTDAEQLVTVSTDGRMRWWNLRVGAEYAMSEYALASSGPVHDCALSPNDELLLTRGRRINVWNASTGALYTTLDCRANSCTFSADGRSIVAATVGYVCVWNAYTGVRQRMFDAHHGGAQDCIVSLANNIMAATVTMDGMARVWQNTGAWQCTLTHGTQRAHRCALSRDGKRLAVITLFDDTVQLWDIS
jgi:WD40 repeat protein